MKYSVLVDRKPGPMFEVPSEYDRQEIIRGITTPVKSELMDQGSDVMEYLIFLGLIFAAVGMIAILMSWWRQRENRKAFRAADAQQAHAERSSGMGLISKQEGPRRLALLAACVVGPAWFFYEAHRSWWSFAKTFPEHLLMAVLASALAWLTIHLAAWVVEGFQTGRKTGAEGG